jgi:hypothetical protein
MDISTINWLAVFVAALAAFLLGGLWYSPLLFYKAWMAENNFTEEDLKRGSPVKIYGFSFLWSLVMAVNLAMYLNDPATDAVWGATAGFLAGFGWAAMIIFVVGLFERKSTRYLLINAGYATVTLTLMGLIIGAWR